MKLKPIPIIANLSAIFVLCALIVSPIYFARSFSQVAGVKTESKYLLISQADKFPQMKFSQQGTKYELTLQKQGENQAYLSVFILSNPTLNTQKYTISTSSSLASVFFGEDLGYQPQSVTIPPSSSIQISVLAKAGFSQEQIVDFSIN